MNLKTLVQSMADPDATEALVSGVTTIASAAASLGIEVTVDEIVQVPSLRDHVLASRQMIMSEVLAELRSIETVAAKLAEKEGVDRLASTKPTYLTQSKNERARMLSEHRANPVQTEAAVDMAHWSTAEHLAFIGTLKSAQARLNHARRYGVC
jgi:hypothetical protein